MTHEYTRIFDINMYNDHCQQQPSEPSTTRGLQVRDDVTINKPIVATERHRACFTTRNIGRISIENRL